MEARGLQQALTFAEQSEGELVALLRALCAIPAPSGGERARAEYCRDYLTGAGARGVYLDDALNAVFPVGCEGDRPVVVFMAHTDTVFPDTSPMPISEEGGRIYCPGVGDDTANLAALLTVAGYVARAGLAPRGPGVVFAANAGEEGLGNLKGCRQLMRDFAGRVLQVVSFDCTLGWVCGHPVGSERYQVTAITQGGHSFADFGKRNAIEVLAGIIQDLYQVRVPVEGTDSHTTYNVGTISGGTSINTICQRAHMTYEYRSDSRKCLAAMRKKFQEVVEAHRAVDARVELTLLGQRPCMGEVDRGAQRALLGRCRRAVERYAGYVPEYSSGSTDCNVPLSMGIPAACLGLCEGGGAHTREEWVTVSSLVTGLKVAMDMILEWF